MESKGLKVSMAALPVGDYIVSDRVCIERKTIHDFESSIIDGRIFEQAKRLKEAYEYPIIIVEGDGESFRMRRNVINGAIASLYIDFGMVFLTTSGREETADLVFYMAKHESEGTARPPSVKGRGRAFTDEQFMERVIGNLPGIGLETAKSLLKHFGSVRAIALASEKELMKADGVGGVRAKTIKNIMGMEYDKCGAHDGQHAPVID